MIKFLTTTYQPAPAFFHFIICCLFLQLPVTATVSPVRLLPLLHFLLFMLDQQNGSSEPEQVQICLT